MGARKDYQSAEFRAKRVKEFWERVNKNFGPDDCWPWLGPMLEDTGYGHVHFLGAQKSAHRMAYELSNGNIADGLFVLHKCDNRICCNPAHLFVGTQADNINDMVAKGRNARGATHGMAVLTDTQVSEIRKRHVFRKVTYQMLADTFSVHKETIARIIQGRSWRD